jgi:alcohol oxidase
MSRGTRAVGVEYVDDVVGRSKGGTQESSFVKASRLVVVSAGSFGSPAILERYVSPIHVARCLSFIRSGIGGTDVLQRNDILQVVDLPGVGEHYIGKIQCLSLGNRGRYLLSTN